ncbi:MAG: acetyl-CoA hydrolase, partial [Desulfobacterales bacterium]
MARKSLYWADAYVEKKLSAKEAIGRIRPGTRVFIGSSCGEPQHLVKALAEASNFFLDLEIVRLLTLETTPLSLIADHSSGQHLNIRSFYLGSAAAANISEKRRFITPINLSAIPRLFKSRRLPIHTALIQVSPPDDFGWMSLGVAVDIT